MFANDSFKAAFDNFFESGVSQFFRQHQVRPATDLLCPQPIIRSRLSTSRAPREVRRMNVAERGPDEYDLISAVAQNPRTRQRRQPSNQGNGATVAYQGGRTQWYDPNIHHPGAHRGPGPFSVPTTYLTLDEIKRVPSYRYRNAQVDASHIVAEEMYVRDNTTADGVDKDPVSAGVVECDVCLLEYKTEDLIKKLPCNHEFHAACIDQWLRNQPVCPKCRANVKVGLRRLEKDMKKNKTATPVAPKPAWNAGARKQSLPRLALGATHTHRQNGTATTCTQRSSGLRGHQTNVPASRTTPSGSHSNDVNNQLTTEQDTTASENKDDCLSDHLVDGVSLPNNSSPKVSKKPGRSSIVSGISTPTRRMDSDCRGDAGSPTFDKASTSAVDSLLNFTKEESRTAMDQDTLTPQNSGNNFALHTTASLNKKRSPQIVNSDHQDRHQSKVSSKHSKEPRGRPKLSSARQKAVNAAVKRQIEFKLLNSEEQPTDT